MHGTLEQLDDKRWQLRFARLLPHPPGKVWRALTEPEHLAHWFPTTIEGERATGAPLRFAFRHDEGPPFDGEMIAWEPPSVLEFRWGTDIVRMELSSASGGTLLTLLDTLDERGKGAGNAAGWHVCLDLLAGHLRGERTDRISPTAWLAVHPGYVERFGPEAATIGPPEGFFDDE